MNRKLVTILLAAALVSASAALPLPVEAGIVRKIVFTRFVGGSMVLYSVNPDGTDLVRLTAPDMWAQDPAISPDGTKVAFARRGAATSSWSISTAPA